MNEILKAGIQALGVFALLVILLIIVANLTKPEEKIAFCESKGMIYSATTNVCTEEICTYNKIGGKKCEYVLYNLPEEI